jgi:hypothetical protein
MRYVYLGRRRLRLRSKLRAVGDGGVLRDARTSEAAKRAARQILHRGRGAPVGAIVRIAYDYCETGPGPNAGDVLVTEAGSAYLILDLRRGRRHERFNLRCLKLAGVKAVPRGARVLPLQWYRRDKRRGQA